MKCTRTACDWEYDPASQPFYRIWNNPNSSGKPPYRDYCIACGRKIIELNNNLTLEDEIKLEYTVVNLPERLVAHYENDPHYHRSDAVESGKRAPAAS